MIQILALRTSNNFGRKAEVWFERGLRASSVEEVLSKGPELFAGKVEKSEQWNVYYTVAVCDEKPPDRSIGEKSRRLLEQHHIPFDVDGLVIAETPEGKVDFDKLIETAKVVCQAIGVKYEETGVVYSGNGLQFLVGVLEPIVEVAYFDRARNHYKAILDRVDLALRQNKIEGKGDPSVWSPARLMRFPGTENRKDNKPTRLSRVLQSSITRTPFTLEQASKLVQLGERDQISETVLKDFNTPDTKTILDPNEGCKFLSWCQTKPEQVSEPEWYAMLSVTARLPEGRKLSHKMSEDHPGYSFEETELKIDQALSPSSGPRTCKNVYAISSGKCLQLGCKHYNTKLVSPILIEGPDHVKTAKTGFYHYVFDDRGNPKRGSPDYDGLVKWFGRERKYVNIANAKKIYIWNGKYYEPFEGDEIEAYAEKNFDPSPLIKQRNEFKAKLYLTNRKPVDWLDASIEGKMNFQNGVLDVRTGVFEGHSPEYGFRNVLPCDYEPKAQCGRFNQFIKEVTADREDLAHQLQEFMGYVFANGECKHQKALLLLGSGENGKSVFVKLIRELAGGALGASSQSIKAMENEQNRALMVGRLVNIAEENSYNSFRETELIKNFISGGEITVKSVYEKPFQYMNRTKLVMLCNELPRTFDTTHGFFRRLIIVPFDAVFSDDLGNKDVNIVDKLMLELPGIFNWAMEGYRRLEKQNRFAESYAGKLVIDQYRDDMDTVHYWLKEHLEFSADPSHEVNRQEVYDQYSRDTKANGGYPRPAHTLFESMRAIVKKQGLTMNERKRRKDGVRVFMMSNLKSVDLPSF